MKQLTTLSLLPIVGLVVALNSAVAEEPDIGKAEYESACAVCHGLDGKGQGPVASQLRQTPTDLTVIAKKNGGVFPINSIYETVDGRKEVKSHGPREMPIWGFRYAPWQNQAFGFGSGNNYIDPLYDPEATIRRHILAIIDYLYRIQEK